mmetsp:Transcript_24838/g.59116  ORF Transcript_24838/g.59116 Transcript_24838/m.59116 type:complete len:318 (+) Transcript_24838:1200-2153(+)
MGCLARPPSHRARNRQCPLHQGSGGQRRRGRAALADVHGHRPPDTGRERVGQEGAQLRADGRGAPAVADGDPRGHGRRQGRAHGPPRHPGSGPSSAGRRHRRAGVAAPGAHGQALPLLHRLRSHLRRHCLRHRPAALQVLHADPSRLVGWRRRDPTHACAHLRARGPVDSGRHDRHGGGHVRVQDRRAAHGFDLALAPAPHVLQGRPEHQDASAMQGHPRLQPQPSSAPRALRGASPCHRTLRRSERRPHLHAPLLRRRHHPRLQEQRRPISDPGRESRGAVAHRAGANGAARTALQYQEPYPRRPSVPDELLGGRD